ncbi:MAG: response regulator [Cyanobacteria bacterium SZAS LIN-2]|nr:response regulator [Cyanobacteria bacterium SZAS LIN-3]MBS1994835.1 response regulator [Cyanobacteria bacterium SZAS LIN-2]MBS2011178.1 response regulator [Cyanobacteria bacterium SZAS TMP-1]
MTEKPFHVLIVEDELKIAEILNDYLTQAGFAVTHKETGLGVVDLVKSAPPDVILLDVMLPGVDGLEICREVRKFSAVPIIMVSARVEELDRLLGLELGADDYICKPFSPREVVARVKVVYRRQRPSQTEATQDKLFQVDEEQGRILARGTALDLTRTEYRLLKLLLSRPGRIFSRDQLLDLCAQPNEPATDRVIDSHIKNLRKKLAKVLPDLELIHAVYGVGYRYEITEQK